MADPNVHTTVVTPINAEVETALGHRRSEFSHANPLPLLEEAQARLQPELDAALGN